MEIIQRQLPIELTMFIGYSADFRECVACCSSPIMDGAVAALMTMHARLPTTKGASPRSADELELALGAAIVKMGPARLLELAPLLGDDSAEDLQIAHPSNDTP